MKGVCFEHSHHALLEGDEAGHKPHGFESDDFTTL